MKKEMCLFAYLDKLFWLSKSYWIDHKLPRSLMENTEDLGQITSA